MAKSYQVENTSYKFSPTNRKWVFVNGSFVLIQACNGAENAHKVARLVNGAMKRGGMDGLARANISKTVS